MEKRSLEGRRCRRDPVQQSGLQFFRELHFIEGDYRGRAETCSDLQFFRELHFIEGTPARRYRPELPPLQFFRELHFIEGPRGPGSSPCGPGSLQFFRELHFIEGLPAT